MKSLNHSKYFIVCVAVNRAGLRVVIVVPVTVDWVLDTVLRIVMSFILFLLWR